MIQRPSGAEPRLGDRKERDMNMFKYVCGLMLASAVLASIPACSAGEAPAAGPGVSGVNPGEWTQDYDAALSYGREKNLPVLLNFTGSDWCYWCKLMDSKVFSRKEWKDYARDNLVLVFIDFPKDAGLVPEKFKDRNMKLAEKYGVRGYPTYVLLKADGKTEIGRLGASKDASPAWFIGETKKVIAKNARLESLSGEARAKYDALLAERDAAVKELEEWIEKEKPERNDANDKKFEEFRKRIMDAEDEADKMLRD